MPVWFGGCLRLAKLGKIPWENCAPCIAPGRDIFAFVDISSAVILYEQGLSLRAITKALGIRHYRSLHDAFVRAGIPRRANNSAWLGVYPRVELTCATCGGLFKRRRYYHDCGNGDRGRPNPPAERFCSPGCKAWGHRRWWLERAARTIVIDIAYR